MTDASARRGRDTGDGEPRRDVDTDASTTRGREAVAGGTASGLIDTLLETRVAHHEFREARARVNGGAVHAVNAGPIACGYV